PDLARRPDRPARSGIVEALAHVPRPGELLRLVLQIAPGEIDADRISIDMVERAALRDVAPARLQRHHQLDLVMEILGGAGKRHRRAVFHHGVAGLGEEERRLPVRIAPHLAGVCRIIASDTEDAPDREALFASGDREGGKLPGLDGVTGHETLLWHEVAAAATGITRCGRGPPSPLLYRRHRRGCLPVACPASPTSRPRPRP